MQQSNSDCHREQVNPELFCCSCISLNLGIGFLAIISLGSGAIAVGFGCIEIYNLYNSKHHVQIRLDPIILKYENPDFDGGRTNYLQVWYAASLSGIISGILQCLISIWFLITIFTAKENDESDESPSRSNYKAKLWLIVHLLVSFIILTLLGGIYIAGFDSDTMLIIFTINFLIVNSCILLSMPLIRKTERQPKRNDFNLIVGKNLSNLTSVLLV